MHADLATLCTVVCRPAVYRCIDKALAAGVCMGLKDTYYHPREPEISAETKAGLGGGDRLHHQGPSIM